jgi:uncharacterized protein YukE
MRALNSLSTASFPVNRCVLPAANLLVRFPPIRISGERVRGHRPASLLRVWAGSPKRVALRDDSDQTPSPEARVAAMPQAIVDPEELRRFAANLKKFNTDVQERLTTLSGQLISLGRTWRDQEHKKFTEEFEQHMKVIAHFTEVTKAYIPYLVRKAESIEQYLQQK